jgi:hypothetical protein
MDPISIILGFVTAAVVSAIAALLKSFLAQRVQAKIQVKLGKTIVDLSPQASGENIKKALESLSLEGQNGKN